MTSLILALCILNLIGLLAVAMMVRRGAATGKSDAALREEFALSRREFAEANKDLRQEVTGGISQTRESLDKRLEQLRDKNDEKLEHIRKTVEGRLETLQKDNADKLQVVTRRDFAEPIYGTPAISGNMLYIRTTQRLYAFGR